MPLIFSKAYDPAHDPYAATVDDISAYFHVQSVSKGGTFLDIIAPSAANYPDPLAGTPSRFHGYFPMRINRSDLGASRPIVVKDETSATTLTRVTASPSTNEYRIPPENSIRRNCVEFHSGQAGHTISYDYYGEASMHSAKEWNNKRWVNNHTITDNYAVLDNDCYDRIDIAHSASTKLVVGALPTLADNQGRRIRWQNTGAGLTRIDGEGSEKISFLGNSLDSAYLLMEDDYIEVVGEATDWKVEHAHISMITNGINRSDWTDVDLGSAFTYDNKSAAVDLTGQHITVADGGSLQKAIILYDSGGTGDTGVMFVYNITDNATSKGNWTNNQVVTCGSGGYTLDVDEASGDSKNIDYNLYYGFGINAHYFTLSIWVLNNTAFSWTNAQLMDEKADGNVANEGWRRLQVDTNNMQLQVCNGRIGWWMNADGTLNIGIDTEDYSYTIIWEISF